MRSMVGLAWGPNETALTPATLPRRDLRKFASYLVVIRFYWHQAYKWKREVLFVLNICFVATKSQSSVPDGSVARVLGCRGSPGPGDSQHDEEDEGGPGHQAVGGRDEVAASRVAVYQRLASNAAK